MNWTLITCVFLGCLTIVVVAGMFAGRKITPAPKEEFSLRDIPMPVERPMPMPARMKNRKLD
jgi:hypothetical protein